MFSKLKEKIDTKKKKFKKAAFLAIVAYVYDKIAGRKKLGKEKYVENVEYEVKEKNR